MSESPVNPYAPSAVETVNRGRAIEFSGGLSSARVWVQTIGAVAASGGLFGVGWMLYFSIVSGRFFNSPVPAALEFVPVLMLVVVVGCVYGGICASIVVPLVFLIGFYARDKSFPWTASRVRLLAAASGFLSGWLSLIVLSLPHLASTATHQYPGFLFGVIGLVAYSLIPGGVGFVGTLLMMEPLARRAGQEAIQRELAAATEPPAPPLPTEPPTN